MKAHFFDIETLLDINNQTWIIDKDNPNVPIMKIPKYQFNLFKSGLYKSQGNKIEFNGKTFWLPTDLMDKIKVKVKLTKSNIANLAISMQEFLNPEIIENMEFEINLSNIRHLKNKPDHIYVICSKNDRTNYDPIIKKLKDKLASDLGLYIKNFYYISETFYNKNDDKILQNKLKVVLQHSIGLKTLKDKFVNEEIDEYDNISIYSENDYVAKNTELFANTYLTDLYLRSDESVKSIIDDKFKSRRFLNIVKVNSNEYNKFSQKEIQLVIDRSDKTNEGLYSKKYIVDYKRFKS